MHTLVQQCLHAQHATTAPWDYVRDTLGFRMSPSPGPMGQHHAVERLAGQDEQVVGHRRAAVRLQHNRQVAPHRVRRPAVPARGSLATQCATGPLYTARSRHDSDAASTLRRTTPAVLQSCGLLSYLHNASL